MTASRQWLRKNTVLIAALITTLIAVVWIAGEGSNAASAPAQQIAPTPTASSTAAAGQFKDVMQLAEQSGLVSSYAFSDTERVIYVTDLWNEMTVSFKKDFLAKVATLQDAITGRQFFEVRNDHSNEKVGEVTAVGGSLQVYR